MKVDVRDAVEFRALRPLDVATYLRSHGWTEETRPDGQTSLWTKRGGGEDFEILLPLDSSLRDFPGRMGELVRTLAVAEDMSQLQVLSELRTDSIDVVRVRLAADGSEGIELNEVVRAIPSVRDMMMAAACAAVEPRQYYHARKFGEADEYLGRLKMGHTEPGSFVVKILSRVPPSLQGQPELFPPGETSHTPPFARRVTQTLMSGLQSATRAAQSAVASGEFAPFGEAVARGASANLIDALIGIAGDDERPFEVQVSWASSRRPPRDLPQRITVAPDILPIFSEVSRLFKEKSPRQEFELEGVIFRLDREPDAPTGGVRIMGAVEGKTRRVSVDLAAAPFARAIRAFDERLPVRVLGELHRHGAGYRLENPRHFDFLPEEPDS